jgi:predicted dehydrogenase
MNVREFSLDRRRFLKSAGVAAAATALPAWFVEESRSYAAASPTKPLSPNDRPGIGLIGCGGQGRGDCNWARNFGDVIAVSDVDDNQTEAAAKQFNAPHKYNHFLKLLERNDVHIIINGTPDHWHTLVNLAAARAGKDIYTEKPLTLTIDEGKRLVKTVREQKRVLQVGSQQRSDGRFRLACELVRNGRIGKLQYMWVGLPTGPREGPFKEEPVPQGLNYDFYVGQARKMPYNGHNTHWNFRWWWEYSGGQMTDWGAHHNDIAQWGNNSERSGPVYVDGRQLKEMIPGGYSASSDYVIYFKYASGVQMIATNQAPNGVRFEGSDGWIFVSRGEIKASKQELLDEPLPAGATRLYKSDNHMGNFFECVRSRKDPICDVEIGHRSISVAHLGVISVRLGRALKWDPAKEEFVGDKEANKWLSREMRKPYDYSFIA